MCFVFFLEIFCDFGFKEKVMRMKMFGVRLILLATLTAIAAQKTPQQYNITAYTQPLPPELRQSVQNALKIERDAHQIAGIYTYCDVNELNVTAVNTNIPCPPAKFRQITGECNNVRHAHWGARGAQFLRLLPPAYGDHRTTPRQSIGTHSLMNSLTIAGVLQQLPPQPHESVTALLGAWSELILHDLASTGNLRTINCCTAQHGECYAAIKDGDCRDYMRTLPSVTADACQFAHREQMNLATAFLDGSAIYGNTDKQTQLLRSYDAGLVNITACKLCKSNALYSAILREHNRIAIILAKMNRHWLDDQLFLESKRIVTAELQHITYNEFLPIIMGNEAIVGTDLQLANYGHFSRYSSQNRAGVYNEVAMTALPALLSMLPHSLMNESASNFAEMIDILISTPSQTPSAHMMVPLRAGWDTTALFIHMGRDHGLPSYTNYLRFCQNVSFPSNQMINFPDLIRAKISEDRIALLAQLYATPEDIDLLAGVLMESPKPGAIVGETLGCLLREQFVLLKNSDRFWYENDLPPSSLSTEQLGEIKKITLAGLLCANTDRLDRIQPRAFFRADPYLNAHLSCDQHQLPQLMAWFEMDQMTDVSEEVLMDALARAEQDLLARRKLEYARWEANGGGVDPKSPVGTAASFSKANPQALKLANSSLLFEFASNEIINSLLNRRRRRQIFDGNVISSVFRDELSEGLQNVDISSLVPATALDLETNCDETGPCDATTPFRTYTGHCNNLKHPNYGKSLTTFARLLPSVYEDGISKPREYTVTGVPLASPRIISTLIHPDISNLHSRYTLMVMQFAQFLDHDLTMTPIHKGFHESIPDCRSCDSARTVHPECNPIPIPAGDHYYPERNISSGKPMCFPFMRSLPGQLQLGPREQVNQNTAFIDASIVYGENHCVLRELKGRNGRMNCTQRGPQRKDLLPQSDHHPECRAESGLCFIAGDGRASEQPGLTVIHTIYMRMHNWLVDRLRDVNSHWDEEKLFQHARRILIAAHQHIIYNEFLPRLLSWNAMNLYGIKLLPQGYYKEYNPNCNPSIFTEFASAAFRIGHSLLRPHIPRLSPSYQIVDPPILLRDGFFKPDMILQDEMVDEISRGLVSTPMETLDQFITGEVTNHLFEDRKIPFSGIDLIALNIQRARDHGIPSYNNYRALCNLKRASTFDDLAREIPPEVIVRLKRIYPTVDDIDLFPGGMSERPLQGGLVGPTFACIIATQFRHLRKCDRFWYENDDPVVRFTESQLTEIRKITLAKVICDHLDHDSDMQRAAFDLPSNFLNPRVPCKSLPTINMEAWRENGGAHGGCLIGDRHVRVGESAFPSPCTSCVCTNEGGQCASLRVTDCSQLLREWSKEIILRDDVCTAQCGFLLRGGATGDVSDFGRGTILSADLSPPPPARHLRTRQLNRPRILDAYNKFSFPDLSDFIAK